MQCQKALPNSIRDLQLDLNLPILKLKSIPTCTALLPSTNLKCWHYHPPPLPCLHKPISCYSLTPKAPWLLLLSNWPWYLCTGQGKGHPVYVKSVLSSMIFLNHLHAVQVPGRIVIQYLKNVNLYSHFKNISSLLWLPKVTCIRLRQEDDNLGSA